MPDRSPRTLWETALGQLELQVTRPNFDTWLRNTVGLRLEESGLVVGVPSDFAIEWLKSRMAPVIGRIVSQLFGSPITVSFEVLGAQPTATAITSSGHPAGPTPNPPPLHLNQHLTFESFTVVESNRLAYQAARQLASGDGSYNPLVLYGSPGLGKTHLLHAIAHRAASVGKVVVLLPSEEFVDRYTKAVRAGHPHTFRDAYRHCDLLLLDDLQFLACKPASQEQFFHLFNSLHSSDHRLVIATDQPPHSITGLTSHLRSRLQAGLSIELRLPPTGERLEILRAQAARLPRPLPEPILQLIAQQPYQHIRELQGALNRVIAFADLTGKPLSLDAAEQALHPLQPPLPSPSPDAILRAVCTHFHLSLDELTSPSRARDITYARHIAMYLLRHHSQRPLTAIGQLLGGRDHSTVLNGCRRIGQEITSLPLTRTDIQQIQSALRTITAA